MLLLDGSGWDRERYEGRQSRLHRPARSASGKGADKSYDVPDFVVAKLRVPGGHGGVLADGSTSLLDDGEEILVGDLVHELLDCEVADVRPEGLRLAATVLTVTTRAVAEEDVPTLRGVAGGAVLSCHRVGAQQRRRGGRQPDGSRAPANHVFAAPRRRDEPQQSPVRRGKNAQDEGRRKRD